MRSAGLIVIASWWFVGCAGPPVARPDPDRLARADAEILQGCYDCLLAAQAEYRRLTAGPERPRWIARLFEVDLLLGLREAELGVAPSDARIEARRLAAELPAALAAPHYLALAEAIPPNDLGLSTQESLAFRSVHGSALGSTRDEVAWLSRGRLAPAVRDYLRLALACAYPPPPGPGALDPRAAALAGEPTAATTRPGPPLLDYRAASCGFGELAALSAVRAREPRFVETSLFAANTELALAPRDGPGRARDHLAEVMARFPDSPAILYLAASYHLFVGEDDQALALYDRVLVVRPTHDRAALGRTICLDRLGRAQDAVDSATRLEALGESHRTDAYFWRARARRALGQLDDARRDIAAARSRAATGDVLSLSGILAYEQADLDAARVDLEAAIAAIATDCTSRWYLALVHRQARRWRDAGGGFAAAMTCYRDRAEASRAQIAALAARADLEAGYRARATASLQASIDADVHQQHAAALTAAACFANGGDPDAARPLLDVAVEDPALAESVAKLRGRLAPPRRAP